MRVVFETDAARRAARLTLYRDNVFLITQEAIKQKAPQLPIEELFATANQFASFLLEHDLSDRDLMQYEIADLRTEISDEQCFYIVLAITFVELCALHETQENAEDIARAIVGFCQEYDGFNDLLKQFGKKELSRWLENKRIDLLSYELKRIGNDTQAEDGKAVVVEFVNIASGLSIEGMMSMENILSEFNDRHGRRYQAELNRLREVRKKKSESTIHIERVNDIHGNSSVNIGR